MEHAGLNLTLCCIIDILVLCQARKNTFFLLYLFTTFNAKKQTYRKYNFIITLCTSEINIHYNRIFASWKYHLLGYYIAYGIFCLMVYFRQEKQ